MQTFINQFDTFQKCDAFRKTLKECEPDIYWKEHDGIVIRDSNTQENIGNNDDMYTDIKLCDMLGCEDYSSTEHTYEFAVFLYDDGYDISVQRFTDIHDAVKAYTTNCLYLHQKLSSQPLSINITGIKCDNCSWHDDSVQYNDYPKWLNKPCPNCGANLLTKKDYKAAKRLMKITKMFNKMYRIFHRHQPKTTTDTIVIRQSFHHKQD